MASRCEYCRGPLEEGDDRCAACGGPADPDAAPPDYRTCPFCRRRLLALGSPACNYCGRALPAAYVRAREATLRRLSQARTSTEREELERDADDLFRQALKSLFRLDDLSRD